MLEMQKAYGRQCDALLVMQGWEWKLAGKFSVEEILWALDKYSDTRDDFPSPSNLIGILRPEEPKVTQAEYIQACKELEQNGYNQFSDAYDVKKLFESQQREERECFETQDEEIKAIAARTANALRMGRPSIASESALGQGEHTVEPGSLVSESPSS